MMDAAVAEGSGEDALRQEPPANNKHIPWQMEWKHPQWIVASNTESETDPDETDQCQIVGITSAKLSSSEASWILSRSNASNSDTNNHYLLTVSLLGIPVENTLEGENNNTQQSLASEVLLEVLEVANHDSSRTIRSKRLRWPESIFDVASPKANPSTSKRNHRQRTKRKNLLEKVFLPLMGIDEEDEYEPRLPKQPQQPSIGIVSATLCRRPTEEMLEKSKETATKDILELMNFDNRGTTANIDPSSQTDENFARTGEETRINDSTVTESVPTKQPSSGELSFVCVSQAGQVFVYDPIQLLLGISEQATEATKNLEEASNFFFGQELFQNLQETWKPLAEPSTRIHLSIFEHDQQKTTTKTVEKLVQSNQELVDIAKDNQSTSSSQQESESQKQPISSEQSVATSGGSSIVTSATDAMTVVQTMAIELQTNVDEALSVLPYLLNPLLEPATLKDRTVRNRPHKIDVSGNSYLVVIGSGVKKKDKKVSKPAQSTGNASVSIQSHGDTVSSRGGPQKSILNEGDTVSSAPEITTKDDAWWEDDASSDQQGAAIVSSTPEKSNNKESAKETNTESAIEDGEENDSAVHIEEDADEIKIEGVTENDDRASNDQEEDTVSKGAEHDAIEEDEENSQRHYFDGYDDVPEKGRVQDRGGFVTFLSTARWSETRTLFLPFIPIRTSHISKWNGMELLWVIGEFESLLIRMDSSGPVPVRIRDIMFGGETLEDDNDLFQSGRTSNNSSRTSRRLNELSPLFVKRFQILPIDLGTATSLSPRLLCASSTGIDPPSILELYIDHKGQHIESNEESIPEIESPKHEQALVLLKTLGYCTLQGTVVLRHAPSHVAKITVDRDKTLAMADSSSNDLLILAEHGQGWSLVGIDERAHFICWEGSTILYGAYVQELRHATDSLLFQNVHSAQILSNAVAQEVSSRPTSSSSSNLQILADTEKDNEPLPSVRQFQEGGDLYSNHDSSGDLLGLSKSKLSRRQNSEYRLQRCSSWSQLEETSRDGILLDMQEPVLCLRGGKAGSPHSMLSLRQLVVENGKHSPFEQVLAWLAQRKNFFVAAGIALDLLKDGDSLYHLWKNAEMIDEEDEETKLFGLLDGIAPVRLLENGETTKKHHHSVTATHLSDMTVGCFIKGGASMAKTLERFLEFNESYNPERVSLMLSLATIDLFSNKSIRSTIAEISPQNEEAFQELIWPIKCLLSIGTEREYLHEVLTLLNNTIPDELRNRYSEEEKEDDEAPKPSLTLTKLLIRLILESDELALEVLMGFVDDQSTTSFWQSLDQSTRLALSLMDIGSSFPLLRHPDVRAWAREELDKSFQSRSDLPTGWLQELSFACLQNANCNFDDLTLTESADNMDGTESSVVSKLKLDMEQTRNALMPSSDKGYEIDYDLLVPSLLLLESRSVCWQPSSPLLTEDAYVSTQSLLNAACHLAGRSSSIDMASPFLFDGSSAMKQCYRVKNVVAGAYLIGGKNGFILHVSDVLHQGIGISIPDAERFLLNDQLDLKLIEESKVDGASFDLTNGHQTLLLLLEEHVFGIKTFGDFNVAHTRGKVDPVFAARSILRGWLSLSLDDKASASSWLGNWLEKRLGISSSTNSELANKPQDSVPSRHRLACATLARSLLWPNNQGAEDKPPVLSDGSLPAVNKPLASTMGFEKKLLIELCQSCLGLVESVPPSIVREIQI